MTPALAQLLIQAGLQYGPAFVTSIIAVLKKPDPTIADIETLFADVKPYSYFNIPDIAPTAPVSAPNAAPTGTVQTA